MKVFWFTSRLSLFSCNPTAHCASLHNTFLLDCILYTRIFSCLAAIYAVRLQRCSVTSNAYVIVAYARVAYARVAYAHVAYARVSV